MRWDDKKVRQFRESARSGLATALTATARGLATASRAVSATASQLRPPEAAPSRRTAPPPPPAWQPRTPADEPSGPPGAESGPDRGAQAVPPAPEPPDVPPVSQDPAPAASEPPDAPAVEPSATSAGDDVATLVERNARDLIAAVPGLAPDDLRRLRTAERAGKARKTVLAAIDRALKDGGRA